MLVYVRGAGDIATGVAARLVRAGVSVVMADIAVPTCIRRTISFCEAIRLGEVQVEGIRARLAQTPVEVLEITEAGDVAVVVDPQAQMLGELRPAAVVDAILAKRNLGTTRDMAPVVIAVGPGFTAPVDCDAVVETMRGHFLGRVITQGSPQPNTGVPGMIGGYGKERVIHSPAAGVFRSDRAIGDIVSAGDVIGYAGDTPMVTQIDGCLRGLLADGVQVTEGFKCADVDPRGDDPAVPATTTSSHVLPAFRAPSAAFTTSSFSIAISYPWNTPVSMASASSTPPPTDVALSEI